MNKDTIKYKILNIMKVNNHINICSIYLFIKNKLKIIEDYKYENVVFDNDCLYINTKTILKTVYKNYYDYCECNNFKKEILFELTEEDIPIFIFYIIYKKLNNNTGSSDIDTIFEYISGYRFFKFNYYYDFVSIKQNKFFYSINSNNFLLEDNKRVLFINDKDDIKMILSCKMDLYRETIVNKYSKSLYVDVDFYIKYTIKYNEYERENDFYIDNINFEDNECKFFNINIFLFLLTNDIFNIKNIKTYLSQLIFYINYSSDYKNISSLVLNLYNSLIYKKLCLIEILLNSLDIEIIEELFENIKKEENYKVKMFFKYLSEDGITKLFNKMDFKEQLKYSIYFKN